MKWTEIEEHGTLASPETLAYTVKGIGTVMRVIGEDCEALVLIPNAKIKGKEIVRVSGDTDWN